MQVNKTSNIEIRRLSNLVVGHVLDVNKKHFETKLKQFDNKLYLIWNPKKNNGDGLWEIRREPSNKHLIYQGVYQGNSLFTVEHVEIDYIHHVLDVPFLNYQVFERLKEMDAWENKNLVEDGDYKAQKFQEQERINNKAELKYQIKHHKKYFQILQEEMKSGRSPLRFFKGQYDK